MCRRKAWRIYSYSCKAQVDQELPEKLRVATRKKVATKIERWGLFANGGK